MGRQWRRLCLLVVAVVACSPDYEKLRAHPDGGHPGVDSAAGGSFGAGGTGGRAGTTGSAGTTALAGMAGATAGTTAGAGSGSAGTTPVAGTTGAAGAGSGVAGTGAAGTSGAAGMTAAAGVDGSAGTAPAGPITRIDSNGTAAGGWSADVDFVGGNPGQGVGGAIDVTGITNPAPQTVYQSTRIGQFTYTVPGYAANTMHMVRLHMAETFYPPAGDTTGGAGRRLCNIVINGTMVETNYDIFVKAGNAKMKAVVPQYVVAADAQGQYVVQFTPTKDNCALGGLEIQ